MSCFCSLKVTHLSPTFVKKTKEMETGKLVKELRVKRGMTQEELAEKTEISARTIQRIENGEVDPRAYTLQMIAKALEVDYSIFEGSKTNQSSEIEKANSNNWLALLHLSGLIPIIIPTVIIWNSKKDDIKAITGHYRAVISFQLIILGVVLACIWVYYKTNILTPFWGVLLINGLLSLTNTLKVMLGLPYIKMPFGKSKSDKKP
jgi:transcriptional regulator with XRE-family HTH domain